MSRRLIPITLWAVLLASCGREGVTFAKTDEDGLRATVRVGTRSFRAGEIISARGFVENLGEGPVLLGGGGCSTPVSVLASIPGLGEEGRSWPGGLGAFKRKVMANAAHLFRNRDTENFDLVVQNLGVRTRAGVIKDETFRVCAASFGIRDFEVGDRFAELRGWDGRIGEGGPLAPTGIITIRALVPRYRAKSASEVLSSPPRSQFYEPITADVSIEFRRGSMDITGVGEAIDRVLEDPRVREWIGPRLNPDDLLDGLVMRQGSAWCVVAIRAHPRVEGTDILVVEVGVGRGQVLEIRTDRHPEQIEPLAVAC